MIEVTTKEELRTAILNNNDDIHIASEKLAAGIMTRPRKFKSIIYAVYANRYRLIKTKLYGAFDVKLVKN